MTPRTVRHLHTAIRDDMGDLMTHRPLPGPALDYLDPFLRLHHYGPSGYKSDNQGLPFKPEPQRGFETLTLVIDGALEHRDGSERRSIGPGGVRWTSAGRGTVHVERTPEAFKQGGGRLEVLELRINLAAAHKQSESHQSGFQKDDIPEVGLDGGLGKIRVMAGRWEQSDAVIDGPITSPGGFFMSTLILEEGTFVYLPVPADHEVLFYVLRGNTMLSGQAVRPCHLVEFEPRGEMLELRASGDAMVVFGHAPRLGEPMVSRGGYVMNTAEELDQAEADERAGRIDGLNESDPSRGMDESQNPAESESASKSKSPGRT